MIFIAYIMESVIQQAKNYISQKLMPIILESGENLEGNIFMLHHHLTFTDTFINKVNNIYLLSIHDSVSNVLEIGFNSGFSALLMLLANPNLKLTCVDICEHRYTIPCFNQLKQDFGDRIQIVPGSSMDVLKFINDKFDLVHIDGSHVTEIAENDIIYSYKLCNMNGMLIMDDYDAPWLHSLWDKYIKIYNLQPIQSIQLYDTPYHDIRVKVPL